MCLISINSPTRFAQRGIIFRQYLNRYYLTLLIQWYFISSQIIHYKECLLLIRVSQKNNDLNKSYDMICVSSQGRRGLVGLFVYPRRQGSADRIPVVPLSFIRFQSERRGIRHEKNVSARKWPAMKRDGERGSGESKKKDRQAFQERELRERRSVRFKDD